MPYIQVAITLSTLFFSLQFSLLCQLGTSPVGNQEIHKVTNGFVIHTLFCPKLSIVRWLNVTLLLRSRLNGSW